MNVWNYFKDKAIVLLVNAAGLFSLSFFLLSCGNQISVVGIIGVVWLIVLAVWLLIDYRNRKKYFDSLFSLLNELEKPYLIAEVMDSSPRLQDRLYREILRKSNRSVIEKIHELEDAGKDYKEYIESWVHEVKLPLTAAKLICENEKDDRSRKLLMQLDRMEKQIETVLFYARMEHTYKDYLIHKVNLRQIAAEAVSANKSYFIQNGMQVSLEVPEEIWVSTDEKWVTFLLGQIFSNAIKYCREENPLLRIYHCEGNMQHSLILEDNGIGIAAEDVGRVFDKGFTGKNGRNNSASTGIGLYLCKNLCEKLGIGITLQSEEGQFTRVILTFPHSNLSEM